MKPVRPHITTIDTLRGIAALTVCLYHFTGKMLDTARIPALAAAFDWGGAGVMIFFAISGFIIPYVLWAGHYRFAGFGSFIGKRFLRICPPSWVVVGLILLQWALYGLLYGTPHPYWGMVTGPSLAANFTYTAPFFRLPWINNVFWTLSIEFQFYLVIALLFPSGFRNVRAFAVSCAALSGLAFLLICLPVVRTQLFFGWSALFLMGSAAMMYYTRQASLSWYLLLLAGLAVAGYFQVGFVATAFAAATALIISFVRFDYAAGAFLGRISYSLYLLHVLCGPVFEKVLLRFIPTHHLAGKLAMQGGCLLLTILASWLFYLTVERYFIRLAARMFPAGGVTAADRP